MDQYIGKMLGNRYEILERIGTGGMAVVYKAKCHWLNRLVAVKILKSDLAQDEDFRRRFNAESQAVAQLSHPNIVSVYDVSKSGDTEYIVMELIDGITLKQYMEKRGQLSWRESLHFITQIMRALSHAHSRGIVHRDIKPQNIMVLRDGSVKVTDFGIACLENSAQTLTQEALGSVHYISPEQARGDRTDARSDIYSAGVVLYEMLTSRLPFEGDSAVSVAIQHLSSIPLAPREINPDIPEQLELICMKAMAPDLDRRYPSADAMIADLEMFRKNPEVNSLSFGRDDLRPDEPDEPTRLLKTAPHAAAGAGRKPAPSVRYNREETPAYREPSQPEQASGKKQKQKLGLIFAGFAAAIVVIVLLMKTIFSSFGSDQNQSYTVPSVLGYTVEEAQQLPEVQDIFTIVVDDSKNSDKYAAGEIMEQSPSAETVTKSNTTIHVTVSLGEDNGEMIDVVNQEARNAEKVLLKSLIEEYDLKISYSHDYSSEINQGYVISTDPAAGEPLKKGDTVTLTISDGPQSTPVPNFKGQNIDRVKAEIEDTWKLKCGEVTQKDSEEEAGTILSQSIDSNSMVDVGTKIDFVVSSGQTSAAPQEYERIVSFELPSDRDSVVLRVEVDGVVAFENTEDCSLGSVEVTLRSAADTATISYYYDGSLQATFPVQFS